MKHLDTELVHRPRVPGEPASASSTPIYQTATFGVSDQSSWDYSRSGNPTRDVLEQQLARLDHAKCSLAYGSGMGAVAAVLRLVPVGSRIVAGVDLYGGTLRLLDTLARERQLDIELVEATDPGAVEAALGAETALVWIETPSNPRLEEADIPSIAQLAHKAGALVAVDNSILSPLGQRPLDLGADLAVQSATKVLGGHSDLTAGVVSVSDEELAERLDFLRNAEGTALAPFECWLLLRGLETLSVRLDRQLSNTEVLIDWLASQPAVHDLYSAEGSYVISLDTGSVDRSRRLLTGLELFRPTVSFGGVTSSINLPSEMSHASVPERWRSRSALSPSLVRLSIGIENVDDLRDDLERGLGSVSPTAGLQAVVR